MVCAIGFKTPEIVAFEYRFTGLGRGCGSSRGEDLKEPRRLIGALKCEGEIVTGAEYYGEGHEGKCC
jgi:hypothetical protein